MNQDLLDRLGWIAMALGVFAILYTGASFQCRFMNECSLANGAWAEFLVSHLYMLTQS